MDSKQGVCLFFQRTGTCKLGDKCPLSHVTEERGITTKYDDRIWQHAQASTSGPQPELPRGSRRTSFGQRPKPDPLEKPSGEQQSTEWNFRVMTYNILAEGLATAHGELLYQQVPTWCLKWNYRWPGLLAEIVHYKPDVMSLQEVDHFDELASRLEPLGYEGRYAQRSGGRSDGCATFWRKDIFIAVAVDIIRFQSYGLQDNVALLVLLHRKASFPEGEDTASESVVEVRMTVDESGDVSMLSGEVQKWFRLHAELPVETLMDPALLVANTHILFNPKRGDIKIAQLRTLLNVMNDIVRKCNGNALGMVMGDFNSTPQSAVYQFIKAGELDCQTVPRKHVSGQVQGTSWPAALEKMARQRSAPAALSVENLDTLLTPPATPSSPQKSDFWGSPPQKSPTYRNPRKKPLRLAGAAAAPKGGLSRGMKHVASEPQLFALDGSGDYGGVARSIVQPLKLTAHTVPALQTLPDTTPPLLPSSSSSSPRQQPNSAPANLPNSAFASPQPSLPQRPNSDSAFFAPTVLKPRKSADGEQLQPSGRKLQQIPSNSEILIHVSPGNGHQTPFTSGPYSSGGPDPCPTLPSSPAAAVSARAAAAAAAADALASPQPSGHSEGLPPRPFSPPGPSPLGESSDLEQRSSSSCSVLSPTSRLAADIGLFSPRRLPPKLLNTSRHGGFGDSQRSSGDLGHLQARKSGDRPRLSADRGPPIVKKPLFRDDSCTWSPEQLQMAVGFPPEDFAEEASLAHAESADSPGVSGSSGQDPEPTWVARHPLKLRSAYSEVTGSEPPYTTCHSKFLGTVDYMWYTPNADKGTTLLPTKTLVPPPLEHLYCGLPSPEWQSDHMSLVTDFSVRRRISKNSILLSGLHKEANMVRARSKLVDSEVFAAALAAVNRDKPGS
ncbi:hypothetical protein WJX82_008002 [Trebouxia sp. C0006]